MIDTQEIYDERMRKFKKAIYLFQEKEIKDIKEKSEEEQAYEHSKIIREDKEYYEGAYEKKFKGIEVEVKIQKSRKINEMRMSKMRLRFEMIEKIQQEIKGKILSVLQNQNTYEELLRKLLIQGMIKLLEEKVEVQCLKKDLELVKKVAARCEQEFAGMGEIKTKLVVNENRCLSENDLGGVILCSYAGRIVCNNTMRVRLEYALQLFLPDIRSQLFGERS